jgi:predicted nucleic acid-binding protein
MAFKHLFVDSDVLLDLLLERAPFYTYSKFLFFEGESRTVKLSTSTLVIANVNYILEKRLGSAIAKQNVKTIVALINLFPFEVDIIDKALTNRITDFEDAIQSLIAERYYCDAIITRNTKDYKHSTLPVFTPEQFLKTL